MQSLLDLLLLSIMCAFIGFGFQRMMDPDMIFTFYRKWLESMAEYSKLWYHITKPLGRCIICNTTWIGMICAFVMIPDIKLFTVLVIGVTSAGIVVIIQNTFQALQK